MVPEEIARAAVEKIKAFLNEALKSLSEELNGVKKLYEKIQSEIEKDREAFSKFVTESNNSEKTHSVDKDYVDNLIKEAIANIPEPKPGKDADINEIKQLIDEAVARIPKARDGEDGRNAVDIDIQASINTEKSYPRGTYAMHNGGLWRSYSQTEGLRGWECVVNGIADIQIEHDGARAATIKTVTSSGQTTEKQIIIPSLIYRGVFKEGAEYEKGDTATFGGGLWHCEEATTDKPGTSKAWTLAVKRGADGKDKK